MTSTLESFDAVSFAAVLHERLAAATARLAKTRGHADEKGWLDTATVKLEQARAPYADLLQKALRLPELEVVRAGQISELQNRAVDEVERLQAGITFHTGSRMPLLDSLFGKLKFASLRRAEKSEFEKFTSDFEKRLNTQYARRLLVTPAFEFATPVIEQMRAAFTSWGQGFAPEPMPEDEAAAVSAALAEAAAALELPLKQVRLLAEAALAPIAGAYEESGLAAKPKKRTAAKPKVEEPPAFIEEEAPKEPRAKKSKKKAAA